MKVMVMVKATPGSEAGELPSQELLAAMGAYNEALVQAGIMLAGEGLHPSSKGARVRFSGTNRTVIDGPFAETKELVAGFWLWRVDSIEQAIEWVRKCPNPMNEESEIEIRQVFSAEDFGDQFTPELREQEASLRAAGLGLQRPSFCHGPARAISGLKRHYTAQTRSGIPQHWSEFVEQAARAGVRGDYFGVCCDAQEGCEFQYLTGAELAPGAALPSGWETIELPARRYAVFVHSGHVSAIPQTLEKIWGRWAPDCGLALAAVPCFERYTGQFNPQTGLGGMEIWVPLD